MNYLAIVVAAVSSFMLGGLWYSKNLFGAIWVRENGGENGCEKGGEEAHGHPAKVFGISLLFSLVAAYCFARLLPPTPDLASGMKLGLLVGLGFVAASFGINYQFAERTTKLWLVDGGYHVVQFLIFGLVLGIWP